MCFETDRIQQPPQPDLAVYFCTFSPLLFRHPSLLTPFHLPSAACGKRGKLGHIKSSWRERLCLACLGWAEAKRYQTSKRIISDDYPESARPTKTTPEYAGKPADTQMLQRRRRGRTHRRPRKRERRACKPKIEQTPIPSHQTVPGR